MPLSLRPKVPRLEQQRLETRLRSDTFDTFYREMFEALGDNVFQVIYKTLGEYAGRVVVYVFAYDTFTHRVQINQLFYRSTGTSRDQGFEGMWFPMVQFDRDPFAREGYRIGKLEDYYLDEKHMDEYVRGAKNHPDDDIDAYGRYLRRDLAVVGAWLRLNWTRPATMGSLDPAVLDIGTTIVLHLSFRRPLDVQYYVDMILSPYRQQYTREGTELEITFVSHTAMMDYYDETKLSDVLNQTMLGIKRIFFI